MDIAALTNAITDIIVDVDENYLERYGIRKAVLNNFCDDEEAFRQSVSGLPHETVPAGSSANVIFNSAANGLKTALLGTVGDDVLGQNYIRAVSAAGIIPFINVSRGNSAACYVLVTPDNERTLFTKIGVAYRYDFDLSRLGAPEIFHTSGFELLTNPERTLETISYAKTKGSKVSFDLSDPIVIAQYRTELEAVLRQTDILFATTEEAGELTGIDGDSSLDQLRYVCPVVALKKGKQGSIVTDGKTRHIIPAYPVQVVNTCGAGDAYTSGFLYGIIQKKSINECGHLGSRFASRICGMRESHF